jgi:predicted GNAT family acetyltransferase
MEILIKENETKGFALAQENDTRAGMMSYSIASPQLIIIDHTEVEPAYNGKGIGKQMLYKIVAEARQKNIKIIPLCPFAAGMFNRLADIRDVLK